jgi:hypothetical protein
MIDPIDGNKPSMLRKMYSPNTTDANKISGGYIYAAAIIIPWFFWHRQSVTIPIVKSFFHILRTENPDLKIGVAGFCWGGRYALLLGQQSFSDIPLVDAVFTGHPSLVSIPKDIERPICPASIAVAGTDTVFSNKMAAKTEALWKKHEDVKTEIVIYEGAKHGFCVRGNMNNQPEKEDMEKAIDQVFFPADIVSLMFRLSNGLEYIWRDIDDKSLVLLCELLRV